MWKIQRAKQRFSKLVDRALRDGPQVEEYRRLREGEPDLKRFLMEGPDLTVLDIAREDEPARRVEF